MEPYKGFTSDGTVRKGVYDYLEDEGAPTEAAISKTKELLLLLSTEQKGEVQCGEVTDDEFRIWSNPELYVNPGISFRFLNFVHRNLTLIRRAPSRRIFKRDSSRNPRNFESISIREGLCKDSWMLSYKWLPWTTRKWQESP